MKKCVVCEADVDHPLARYCTERCRKFATSEMRKIKRATVLAEVRELRSKECAICGKQLSGDMYRRKFCSDACIMEQRRRYQQNYREMERTILAQKRAENMHNFLYGKPCAFSKCDRRVVNRQSNAIYCSRECQLAALRHNENRTKPNTGEAEIERRIAAVKLGCEGCKHSRANKDAINGYECLASLARICKPYTPGHRIRFEPA